MPRLAGGWLHLTVAQREYHALPPAFRQLQKHELQGPARPPAQRKRTLSRKGVLIAPQMMAFTCRGKGLKVEVKRRFFTGYN